jgi:hypothetical protein
MQHFLPSEQFLEWHYGMFSSFPSQAAFKYSTLPVPRTYLLAPPNKRAESYSLQLRLQFREQHLWNLDWTVRAIPCVCHADGYHIDPCEDPIS